MRKPSNVIDRSPIRLLHRASQGVTELFVVEIGDNDLTQRQLTVLITVAHNENRNQAELVNLTVVDPTVCHHALAVMATAGLYETSGDWLYDIGLPGKSGIGGGIVTVSPGKGGLGTFAPPLDRAGNSVKGQLVARFLSQRLGMDLFVSKPVG